MSDPRSPDQPFGRSYAHLLIRTPVKPPITFLPLMRRPCRSVEKESAETCMRALLERTCAELRLKNDVE